MSTISSLKNIENKHDVYRGKHRVKIFCEFLREHTILDNFEKNKINLLANEQQESYENAKVQYICKEKFKDKYAKDKKCHKFRDNCHYAGGAAHNISHLKYSVPKKILYFFYIMDLTLIIILS